jgi:hypothetical protein
MNGFWKRVGFAFRCFFSILFHGEIPSDVAQEIIKPGNAPQPMPRAGVARISPVDRERAAPESSDRAVQMLALLQRDGRLIDFLAENVSGYPDAQLGAAVREIHDTCRQALDHYVKLEPILNSEEDQPVTVPAGFDSVAIKLIGNVRGEPPVRGVLRHKGWRVKEVNLPPMSAGAGRKVVAPAEVELP